MLLVVDANILVGELLRARGQTLLRNRQLTLAITERARNEAEHELRRRLTALAQAGRSPADRVDEVLSLLENTLATTIEPVDGAAYAHREYTARRRIPRDPDDWPTVALALEIRAAIWTQDADFLGC